MSKVALVVDDSMLIRFTVCRFLEERGYTVESASNGAEAVQILARIHPGLVVTDLDMPQMSGSEFITVLKAKPETALIPIIIVAGRASRARESETRGDFAIYKDIDIESQLEKAVSTVLSKAKAKPAAK
ncbi:MAG: response regulator [Candidatus Sulfotelmatobacter sp.]